jgi:hypothetical protein
VALADFPGKFMELGPMLADILFYGRLCLNRIHGNSSNLVDQSLFEFFALRGGEEL